MCVLGFIRELLHLQDNTLWLVRVGRWDFANKAMDTDEFDEHNYVDAETLAKGLRVCVSFRA